MSTEPNLDYLIPVLKLLSDGEYHSGEEIGALTGVSRAAIWKQLKKLESLGCNVESSKGVGYRLKEPIDCLDETHLKTLATEHRVISSLEVLNSVSSTNTYVLAKKNSNSFSGCVVFAESQTAGRGRRGRVWQSPFGRSLYMSLGWRVTAGVSSLEGLSLAVGVAIVETLDAMSVNGVQLKWPNDLIWNQRKLGGVLIEIDGDLSGDCNLVVGVGLNVNMPSFDDSIIDQPWVDLKEISQLSNNHTPSRTILARELAKNVMDCVSSYEREGFAAYKDRWMRKNYSGNKLVTLLNGSEAVKGINVGITETGALILEVNGEVKDFSGGELSLRLGDVAAG